MATPTHSHLQTFNPDRVARLEASGWRAYYAHQWLRALLLMIRLVQEQFHIPFPRSVQAAYYIIRASMAFAPRDNAAALPAVGAYISQFYAVAASTTGNLFHPPHVANLELQYWNVHRAFALAQAVDDTPMVDVLAALHAALFGSTAEAMRPSAVNRARAAHHVDLITGERSINPDEDWRLVYFYLRRCYEQVKAAL